MIIQKIWNEKKIWIQYSTWEETVHIILSIHKDVILNFETKKYCWKMHLSTTGFFLFQKEGKDKKKRISPTERKKFGILHLAQKGNEQDWDCTLTTLPTSTKQDPFSPWYQNEGIPPAQETKRKKNHSKEEVPQSWQRWWSCNNNTTCFQDSDHSRQEMKNSSRIISLPKRFLFPTTLGQAEKKLYEQQNWERESCWDSFSGFSRAWNNAFAHIST